MTKLFADKKITICRTKVNSSTANEVKLATDNFVRRDDKINITWHYKVKVLAIVCNTPVEM